MYYDPDTVKAIHRDRMDQLRRARNPRRGWRDDADGRPRRRPRPEREL